MYDRRDILGLFAAGGAAVAGIGPASGRRTDDDHDHGSGTVDSDLEYVRNVEEVRGHLTSSVTLLEDGRLDDSALHAGHPGDYFGAILPPVRDADPALASRLRARLRAVDDRVSSLGVAEYESFVFDDVFPLLEAAVETVVPASKRQSDAFDVRVMNALAARIAEEYSAAVAPDGTIELQGEYWDGRGFLVRVENRFEDVASTLDDATAEALSRLRSEIEAVASPSTVRETTIQFRVVGAAAAELPAARVDSRESAVAYVRNAEEVHGHARAALSLLEYGDDAAATLHAGHGADYAMTLLPPLQRETPQLATRLRDQLLGLDERVDGATTGEFETFVTDSLSGSLDGAETRVVPDVYAGETAFDAAVAIALLDRIEDEYTAAVTEDEVIELYGEYWDARGFFDRVQQRYDSMRDDLSEDVRDLVEPELDTLGSKLENAAPPADVVDSIDPLTDDLGRVVEDE